MMKKCSTAVLLFLFVLVPQAVAKARCEFLTTVPNTHRVKEGDTLWQIAATFLENPWCWSTVWERNREQIRDPHWIYPGQTIYFDRERQQLSLRQSDAGSVVHRSPSVRTESLRATPLPLIASELGQRLNKTTLVPTDALVLAPQVAGLADGRRMAAMGDAILVSGALNDQTLFQVIRPLQTIADPDTGKPLALTSLRVGTAHLLRLGSDGMHQFKVASSDAEILLGDRLVPLINREQQRWLPHPTPALSGRVAAVLRGATWASVNDVVAINRGLRQGLDNGSVVAVVRHVRIHRRAKQPTLNVFMPDDIATLLVFDVADEAALALVMRARDSFTIGDTVESVDEGVR
jgi:hypothetical protein